MKWPMVKLGELTDKVKSWNPLTSSEEESFLYIDLSSVDKESKKIDGDLVSNVLPLEAPSRARQLVQENDVIVATVRPNLNGVALIESKYNGSTASTGYCVLRPKENKLYSKYLFYWVQTDLFIADMMSKATGANYPAVSDRIIKDSQIPLPPLEEQKRIAAILDKADAIRRKRQQAIDLADEFLRSVFLDIYEGSADTFVDVKMIDLALKEKNSFVNGPFGSDLLTSELTDQGVPVVYIRDIRQQAYNRVSSVFVTPNKAERLSSCSVKPNDVLVAKVGDPPGFSAVYPESEPEGIVTQDVIRIRCNEDVVLPHFLSIFLNSKYGKRLIDRIKVEATRSRVGLGDLKKEVVKVPSLDVQFKFQKIYELSSEKILKARTSYFLADQSFKALSQKAFTGEL